MNKRLVLFMTVFFMFCTNVFAADILYSNNSAVPVVKGVVRKSIHNLTADGWQNINVIEADLSEPSLSLALLYSPLGVSRRDTVEALANANEAVAAINAEFFGYVGDYPNGGYGVGFDAVDDEIITSPSTDETLASFVYSKDGGFVLDYFSSSMSITYEDGTIYPVNHINQVEKTAKELVLYTPKWGEYSRGTLSNGLIEIVVEKDVITDIRSNLPPAKIPKNGYVIVGYLDEIASLRSQIKIGGKMTFSISISPQISPELAIGGGTILLKDGKFTKLIPNIAGRHPRSAIGIDSTGKKLYLVTVDGRGAGGSIGMSLEELRTFLVDFGVYNAINLDGGGSTQMVAKPIGKDKVEVVNTPSENPSRKVINAAALRSQAKGGTAEGIVLSAYSSYAFCGAGVAIGSAVYDGAGNILPVDTQKISFRIKENNGKMLGNVYYPALPGRVTIEASYNGKSANVVLDVLDAPSILKTDALIYTLKKGQISPLSLIGISKDGHSVQINPMYISFASKNNLVRLSDSGLIADKQGTDMITLQAGNATATASVYIDTPGNSSVLLRTFFDGFETLNAKALAYPAFVPCQYELSKAQKSEGSFSGMLSYDFSIEHSQLQSAAIAFDTPPVITNANSTIAMDVFASAKNQQWLRMMVVDQKGEIHRFTLYNKVDFNGPKQLSFSLPADIPLPAKLTRIYLVQPDVSVLSSGAIYVDNLSISSPAQSSPVYTDYRFQKGSGETISFTSGVDSPASMFDYLVLYKTEWAMAKSRLSMNLTPRGSLAKIPPPTNATSMPKAGSVKKTENFTIIRLDNTDGVIRKNPEQWKLFYEQVKNMSTPCAVIVLSAPYSFADLQEQKAFESLVKQYLCDRKIVPFIVFKDQITKVTVRDGVRYISLVPAEPVLAENLRTTADILHITAGEDGTTYILE